MAGAVGKGQSRENPFDCISEVTLVSARAAPKAWPIPEYEPAFRERSGLPR
jgi:hypothetical protein